MEAAVATWQEDILPQGTANTGGSQRSACSPECATSCPKLNLGASRTAHSFFYVVKLRQNAQVCTRPYILILSFPQPQCPNFFILHKKIWFLIDI